MPRQPDRRQNPSREPSSKTIPKTDDGLVRNEGWLFRQELVDCGRGVSGRCRKCASGPSHGPYWYRYRWSDGKMHKRYVGKRLPAEIAGCPVTTGESGTGAIRVRTCPNPAATIIGGA